MRSDRHGADRAVERRCGTSVAIRTLCLGDAWGRDGGYSRLSGGVSGGWGVEVLHVLAFTRFFNTVCIVTAGDGVTSVVTSHVSHGCAMAELTKRQRMRAQAPPHATSSPLSEHLRRAGFQLLLGPGTSGLDVTFLFSFFNTRASRPSSMRGAPTPHPPSPLRAH